MHSTTIDKVVATDSKLELLKKEGPFDFFVKDNEKLEINRTILKNI